MMQFIWGNAILILYGTVRQGPVLSPHPCAYPLISHCNHCQIQLQAMCLIGAACTGYIGLFTLEKNFRCLQLENLPGARTLDYAVETKGMKK